MPLTQSDKITLTKYPALPSKCCICFHSADGELDFLDFQMSVDIYGAVVICRNCLIPICQLLGYVPQSEVDTLDEILAQHASVAERLQNDVTRLDSAIGAILDVRPSLATSLMVAYEGANEATGEDNPEVGRDPENEGSDDRTTSEQDSERGPENTSKSTDLHIGL